MAIATSGEVTATPGLPADGLLSHLIRARSVTFGDHIYLAHARDRRALSYLELDQAVDRWSIVFDDAGVETGATVALVVSDPVDFAVAFLGTIAAGRWVAPIDPDTPEGGMPEAIARVGADTVIADRAQPQGVSLDWTDLGDATSLQRGRVTKPGATAPAQPVSCGVVLSSSGTTGRPKLMRLHQQQLLHTAGHVAAHHRLSPDDRGFNPLPLFHINAEVVGLLGSLVAGSTLVLDDRFHRSGFWRLMGERNISWINAVPAIISRLAPLRDGEFVPPGIRFIRSASAPLPIATAERFEKATGVGIVETYGMTEAASQITAHPLGIPRRAGSVGLPVGVELRVVHESPRGETGLDCPIGHVEIRGTSVITSYGGDGHRHLIDGDGWLHTGDLGWLDADGYLYLSARSDDVINRGGEKIYPREIEELILLDPDVTAATVVGAPDAELGQLPVAYLVLRSPSGEAPATVRRVSEMLDSSLVRVRRPVALCVVRELPSGPTGKIKRTHLREGKADVVYRMACR